MEIGKKCVRLGEGVRHGESYCEFLLLCINIYIKVHPVQEILQVFVFDGWTNDKQMIKHGR